jgi:hypothetical protein
MSRFSIIIFSFFYAKISRKEEIFSKNSGKFSAAAEKDIGLHLYFQYIIHEPYSCGFFTKTDVYV